MPKYVYAYRAPKDYQPGSDDTSGAWMKWFEKLGSSVVEVGDPVLDRTMVGDGATETVLSGYSVIDAQDLEQATAMARGCPLLAIGGGVEVGEITPLSEMSVSETR